MKPVFTLPVIKVLLQFALTALNVMCWVIPIKSQNFSQNTTLLSLANCFAGGIFIMLGLGHMLPEAASKFGDVKVDSSVANLFALLGYLVMFFVEKVAFSEAHASMHSEREHKHTHSDSHINYSDFVSEAATPSLSAAEIAANAMNQVQQEGLLSSSLRSEFPQSQSAFETNIIPIPAETVHSQSASTRHEESFFTKKSSLSPKSAIILLCAMSFHSFFEAMALGIASDVKSALLMSTSIGLHQPAESMALLVAFLKTNLSTQSIIKCLGLFSLVAPLGVFSGIFVSKVASPWLEAAIVAITAGTFLYVGATEVVNEEFEELEGSEKWYKFASFIGGVCSILAISLLTERMGAHDHNHSHDIHQTEQAVVGTWSFFFGGKSASNEISGKSELSSSSF